MEEDKKKVDSIIHRWRNIHSLYFYISFSKSASQSASVNLFQFTMIPIVINIPRQVFSNPNTASKFILNEYRKTKWGLLTLYPGKWPTI